METNLENLHRAGNRSDNASGLPNGFDPVESPIRTLDSVLQILLLLLFAQASILLVDAHSAAHSVREFAVTKVVLNALLRHVFDVVHDVPHFCSLTVAYVSLFWFSICDL